jgi:hypothetical protein
VSDRLERPHQLRRAVALAVIVLAAAGVAAGIVLSGGGGSMKAQPTTASRTPVRAAPLPSPRPRKAPRQSSLARLIRIGLPVFCGGPRGRDVALTFDDGPGPYTSLALRILRRAHARSTFYTWTHPDLLLLPRSQMESQLATTQGAVARAGGRRVQLFRPPYGAHDAAVDAETHRLGMLEVLWSVDSADIAGANYDQIQRLEFRTPGCADTKGAPRWPGSAGSEGTDERRTREHVPAQRTSEGGTVGTRRH